MADKRPFAAGRGLDPVPPRAAQSIAAISTRGVRICSGERKVPTAPKPKGRSSGRGKRRLVPVPRVEAPDLWDEPNIPGLGLQLLLM